MRIKVDSENNALYFKLCEEKVVECEEVSSGIILDYAEDGKVVGLEVMNNGNQLTSDQLSNIEFEFSEETIKHEN